MCLTLYDEFLGDKGLGLLRGDVSHHLTREVRGGKGERRKGCVFGVGWRGRKGFVFWVGSS